jgi:hypothetical protein
LEGKTASQMRDLFSMLSLLHDMQLLAWTLLLNVLFVVLSQNTLHSQESDLLVHNFALSNYTQWVLVNSSSNCLVILLLCNLHSQAPISECHYQHVVVQFERTVPCEVCNE